MKTMLSRSHRKWPVAFSVLVALICPLLAGCSQLKPAEPLHIERLTDEQIEKIVAEEVPLGSSPRDVRLWLEHRKLPIHSWEGKSLDEATYIDYDFSVPETKHIYFFFDEKGGLIESGISVPVP